MAGRMRTVKPELWASRQFAALTPMARLTFIGLLNFCDDHGTHIDDPRLIKAEIYPYDDLTAADVSGHLDELETTGIIHRYQARGEKYLHVPQFQDDGRKASDKTAWGQRTNRPQEPRHPVCPATHGEIQESFPDDSVNDTGTVPESSQNDPGTNAHQVPGTMYQGPCTRDHVPARVTTSDIARFGEFYAAYPRHTGRAAAEKSWASALERGVPPDIVIAGASRYAADPNRLAEFTKHPATWLNQACWDDDPLPARNNGRASPPRSTTSERVSAALALAEKYDRLDQGGSP